MAVAAELRHTNVGTERQCRTKGHISCHRRQRVVCKGTLYWRPLGCNQFSNNPSFVSHNLTHHDAVPATCVADGTIEYWSCSDCGKQWSDESGQHIVTDLTAKALGHDYNAQDVCTRCGAKLCSEGHTKDLQVDAVEATYTTAGNIGYYHCSVCNKYYNAETNEQIAENSWKIPAKGHTANHVSAQAATCSKRVTTNVGIAAVATHTLRRRPVKMPTLMMQMLKRACG